MSHDFKSFLQQLQGSAVSVVTWDHARLLGTLAAVADDCIRMTGVILQDSHEAGGWADRLVIEDLLEDRGNQWPEIIIQRNLISTVTLLDDANHKAIDPRDSARSDAADQGPGSLNSGSPLVPDSFSSLRPPATDHQAFADNPTVCIELGPALVDLMYVAEGRGTLHDRLDRTRRSLERRLGFSLQPFLIRPNLLIPQDQFRLLIHGVTVLRGTASAGKMLAIIHDQQPPLLDGMPVREPAYGLPAIWIEPTDCQHAEMQGCTVVDCQTVINTVVDHHVVQYAADLLTIEAVTQSVDQLGQSLALTVSNLMPNPVSVRTLFDVLKGLVKEGVVIRHLLPILESVGRNVEHSGSIHALIGKVRVDIALLLCGPHLNEAGRLPAIFVESAVANALLSEIAIPRRKDGALLLAFIEEFHRLSRLAKDEHKPVLFVDSAVRERMWTLCRPVLERLTVLSFLETPHNLRIDLLGTIRLSALREMTEPGSGTEGLVSESHERKPR